MRGGCAERVLYGQISLYESKKSEKVQQENNARSVHMVFAMKSKIKIYHTDDKNQKKDEKEFRKRQTVEYKLDTLEHI